MSKIFASLSVCAVLLAGSMAQAGVIKINVTQGNALDNAAGFTNVGSGTHTVDGVAITVGNRTVPGQSNWYNPGTEAYEGYGLESQSGKFIDLSSTAAMTQVQVNVSWYENDAQYVTYTPSSGPTFAGSQPWWWNEDGGVSASWGAGNKTFSLSSNAALFTNAAIVTTEGAPVVPEPSSIALLVVGAFSMLGYAWRRRRA